MERRAIEIVGVVQGVGFRPFVHALATRLNLRGFVTNHGGRVEVEVEGDREALVRFEHELASSAPALARIESIIGRSMTPQGDADFRIASSVLEASPTVSISPDVATCDACLAELFDPRDRRYRYPFINCTACGPRLTIITGSPYDRERTTMARFEMCGRCRAEYEDPTDRRFHAEPIACPHCGPRLETVDAAGRVAGDDPIASAAAALIDGRIVAVKGLGGFHLACDAGNADAVAMLRTRKHRDEKPFAVMVGDVGTAASLCEMSAAQAAVLHSAARPIMLLKRHSTYVGSGFSRTGARPEVCEHVAPQSSGLGLMLPYTPVHHLLMSSIGRRALVMTSGNRSDEPIAVTNEDARARLRDIADLFLIHDRDIRVRCEDSVVREIGSSPVVIRRSRGYAPLPIALPFECPSPILAVGGQLKNTFALGSVRRAFLSHHAGDLDEWLALDAFERDIDLYERTFHIAPTVIAHDLHPDYASTRIARRRTGVTHVGVQHHHAHVAACMAEHRVEGPVIGVAWDGAGWGPDGCVWGGEFLVGDRFDVQRIAHFRYVALPGGDRAAREPWRMALAHLQDAGVDDSDVFEDVSISARRTVAQMIERGVNAPMTSSVGRLFDAVAAICGAVKAMTFEGQAAMWLESLAEQSTDRERYPFTIAEPLDPAATMTVDTRPLIRALDTDRRRGVAPGIIARRFHRTLAEVVRDVALLIRARTGLNRVALSGGVFLNALLTAEVETQLVDRGFEVYRHHLLPPGDGGLSLGQLAVAAARIATKDI